MFPVKEFKAPEIKCQESMTPSELGLAHEINDLAGLCHSDNRKWWTDPVTKHYPIDRNKGELLMLMVTELAEAFEGERKNQMDDKLPHRKMAEVELADAIIRILDYAAFHGYDVGGALIEKRKYNAVRKDHTFEERLKPNGKRF